MKFKSILAVLLFLILTLNACKKKDSQTDAANSSESFDKQAMLVNIADHVILPDYANYTASLDTLTARFKSFKTITDLNHFQLLKQAFNSSYTKYQRVSLYGFGPAEDVSIRSNCNIFPCNTSNITANISSGVYTLDASSNLSAKGFPALDYLLYGENQSEQDVFNLFLGNANRWNYLQALITDLSEKMNKVNSSWQSSYRQTFITSLGTDLGSSIGFLVNQLNFELDYLKNSKLATPLGLKSAGVPLPKNCEAYYGGQSVQYALETLMGIEDLYLGRNSTNENGLSFDDYLNHLDVKHVSTTLNQAINTQFSLAKAALQAVPNPLSEQVLSNSSQVKAAHDELIKLIVLLKSDMPSALGVVITYQDGDGD